MRKGAILNLKWPNADFRVGIITVEGTKNGEIRKIPMNKKLTEALESAKKGSRSEGRLAQMDRALVSGTHSGIFCMSLKPFINYSNRLLSQ